MPTQTVSVSSTVRYEATGPDGAVITVQNLGPDSCYYATAATVSSGSNDGTLTLGSSITFPPSRNFISAGTSRLQINTGTLRPAIDPLAELKRTAQLPSGVIDETLPRDLQSAGVAITSATLLLCGHVSIRAGQPVTSLGTRTSTTAIGSPTAQWMCLVRVSDLAVLCKTEDRTSEAWTASTDKNFTVASGPFIPLADTLAFVGLLIVHGGTGTIGCGATGTVLTNAIAPIKAGTSTAGLSTPASLGATAGAVTAVGNVYRAWYS